MVLEELKERVEHTTDFPDIVVRSSNTANRIEFIEEVDAGVFSIASKMRWSFAAVSPHELRNK